MLRAQANRLARRDFAPLRSAPKTQGRAAEIGRLVRRYFLGEDNRLARDANEWLMKTMARECARPAVRTVHAYEDCSLRQFERAKRTNKACVYDLPIGYFAAWDRIRADLEQKYRDWLPFGEAPEFAKREQKRQELELADLVLVPSQFVADTVREFVSTKAAVAVAPYGVDAPAPTDASTNFSRDTLTFLFAGRCSLRKGTPLLIDAWRASNIKNARLLLVGPWWLDEKMKSQLPSNCEWIAPVSADELQIFYRTSDVFVFPTNFEGRALVVLEALAAGLPVLTTPASGFDELTDSAGRMIPPNDLDALVEGLKWFDTHRDSLPEMRRHAARAVAPCGWARYRQAVSAAVQPFV